VVVVAPPRRRPWNVVARLWRGIAGARRFPVLPVAIILFLLVIPAIFANLIAPHDHRIGDLNQEKVPPAWVSSKVQIKQVVEKVNVANRHAEISLSNAERNIRTGRATLMGGAEGGEVALGDQVEVVTRRGGSKTYLLGTDKLGRDILSRIIHGARISLTVSLVSIAIGGGIGVVLGLVAGYFGGLADALIMRLVDIALAFPALLLALVLSVIMGSGFDTVIIVLVVLIWARYARMVRGEAQAIKQNEYVARARVAGASHIRIMVRHILPNLANTVIVLATLEVGHVIILESTLSFLGAGIPRPTPAWGVMVADGRELITSEWWIFLFPTMAIVLTVLSMNLLGDWLRDKLDPKLRNV